MGHQKSIVIFSEKYDYSTLSVAKYLTYLGEKVIRINPEDTLGSSFNIAISKTKGRHLEIGVNDETLRLDNIKSIWFRRGGLFFKKIDKNNLLRYIDVLHSQLNQYFSAEQTALNHFIYNAFINAKIKVLGNPFQFNTNKLAVLTKAIFHKLEIPYTFISTSSQPVYDLVDQKNELITKAIQDNFTPVFENGGYGLLTQTIDKSILDELPSHFFPSLFQEKLDKKFDLRIFYLDGAFYSIAILSQENEQTATDFRNYDASNPNRRNIFDLPGTIKNKLSALLKDLDLNTASIDMVYTKDNRYVFLEINPVGQYDMVGKPMNFQLDKKIALWLARK